MTTMIVSLARRSDDCSDDEESCENEDEPCEIGGGLQLQGSGNEEFGKDALDALERLYRASPDFPDHSETLLMQAEQLEKLWNLPDAEGYHVRENIVATSDHDFRMTSSSSDVLQGLERSVSLLICHRDAKQSHFFCEESYTHSNFFHLSFHVCYVYIHLSSFKNLRRSRRNLQRT
jgi:hypothetical protein